MRNFVKESNEPGMENRQSGLCEVCIHDFTTCKSNPTFGGFNNDSVLYCDTHQNKSEVNKPENQCAHLKVSEENFSFQDMLNLQKNLQADLAIRLPETNIDPLDIKSKGQMKEWFRDNRDAISDEFTELIEAIGGQDSAIWKKWKSNHVELCAENWEDLSKDEMLELKYEAIDIMHFMNNIFVALKMDAKEIGQLYAAKNAENLRRYKEQY